jgi:hypothetical protein
MGNALTDHAMRRLLEAWGGRLPTWEEFKKASRRGEVRVHKTIAFHVILDRGQPLRFVLAYVAAYSMLPLQVLSVLFLPVALVLYVLSYMSGWWVVGTILAAWIFGRLGSVGRLAAIASAAAERDKELYQAMLAHGALIFEPKS